MDTQVNTKTNSELENEQNEIQNLETIINKVTMSTFYSYNLEYILDESFLEHKKDELQMVVDQFENFIYEIEYRIEDIKMETEDC